MAASARSGRSSFAFRLAVHGQSNSKFLQRLRWAARNKDAQLFRTALIRDLLSLVSCSSKRLCVILFQPGWYCGRSRERQAARAEVFTWLMHMVPLRSISVH